MGLDGIGWSVCVDIAADVDTRRREEPPRTRGMFIPVG